MLGSMIDLLDAVAYDMGKIIVDKVDNEDVWENYIKSGEFKGFSVEGMFKTVAIDKQPQTTIDQIIDVVKGVDASKVDEVMSILKKANIN